LASHVPNNLTDFLFFFFPCVLCTHMRRISRDERSISLACLYSRAVTGPPPAHTIAKTFLRTRGCIFSFLHNYSQGHSLFSRFVTIGGVPFWQACLPLHASIGGHGERSTLPHYISFRTWAPHYRPERPLRLHSGPTALGSASLQRRVSRCSHGPHHDSWALKTAVTPAL